MKAPLIPVSGQVPSAQVRWTSHIHTGTKWLLWTAGLFAVNSLFTVLGFGEGPVVGIGIGRIIVRTALYFEYGFQGFATLIIGFLFCLGISALLAILGIIGQRGNAWAFLLACFCIAIDASIAIRLGIAYYWIIFHFISMIFIGRGAYAAYRLDTREIWNQ